MKYFKYIIIFFLFLLIFMKNALSIENKILLKIDNEIITSIDVEKEYRYLAALNKNFKDLDKKEIFEISKKSIINEKIKIIEINKSFKNPSIKEEYLELVISNIYKRIGLNDLKSFKEYLKNVNVKYLDVKKKIEIESLWNELIIAKFSSKININVNEIKKDIINNKKNISKSYLLSEIFFEVQNSNEINTTYEKIKDTILKKGFENAAITFSLSSTASQGGNLGWIEEDSVNKNLREVHQ